MSEEREEKIETSSFLFFFFFYNDIFVTIAKSRVETFFKIEKLVSNLLTLNRWSIG